MGRIGFFTDTTVCIGCKACEVACKQWNQLPDDGFVFTAMSYDNTGALGASTWRHVAFVERATALPAQESGLTRFAHEDGHAHDGHGGNGHDGHDAQGMAIGPDGHAFSWLMVSDVCKHCERAGCLEACPTGAIMRTEFDTVYVQPDICNGCGYCVVACPFGVIDRRHDDGRAFKCTLCYDRLKDDLEPACAKACPTDSILFGDLDELKIAANRRVEQLHARGVDTAYLYGADAASQPGTEGLHAFFLLVDRPEVYNLPPDPVVPTKKTGESWMSMGVAMLGVATAIAGVVLASRES